MRRFVSNIFILGCAVQICLGAVWLVTHLGHSPSEVLGQLGALACACLASCFFLGMLGFTRGRTIFGALAMLTFPMALQCHMEAGPYSFMASLELLQVGLLLRFFHRNGAKERYFKGGLVAFLAITVLLVVMGIPVEKRELGENPRIGWPAVVASRVAWSSLNADYPAWPESWQEDIPLRKMRESSYYGDNMNRVLLPYMEEVYGTNAEGTGQIREMLLGMSAIAWDRNAKGIVKNIMWDLAGYTLSPAVVECQLAGMGYDSCTGVLYGRFLERTRCRVILCRRSQKSRQGSSSFPSRG